MVTKLRPAGDGASLFLPQHFLDQIGLTDDLSVIVRAQDGSIVVTPLRVLPDSKLPYKSAVRIALERRNQTLPRHAEQIKEDRF